MATSVTRFLQISPPVGFLSVCTILDDNFLLDSNTYPPDEKHSALHAGGPHFSRKQKLRPSFAHSIKNGSIQ